jgi:hypothetical protein
VATILADVGGERRGDARIPLPSDYSTSSTTTDAPLVGANGGMTVESTARGKVENSLSTSASCPNERVSTTGEVGKDEEDESASAVHSFLASLTTSSCPEGVLSGSSSSSQGKKRKNRRPKKKLKEPEIEILLDGEKGVALTDPGSQADVFYRPSFP